MAKPFNVLAVSDAYHLTDFNVFVRDVLAERGVLGDSGVRSLYLIVLAGIGAASLPPAV